MGFESAYKNRGFAVVGVSLDGDGWKSVKPYIAAKGVNYPIVVGTDAVANLYKVPAMPVTLLIDRNGNIAATHKGVINKESYAALSASQKAVFDKHTGKVMSLKAAKIFDDWADESFQAARAGGKVEVIQLPPEIRKAMFDAAQPVVQKTLGDLEKDGITDARAVYAAINK